MRILALAPGLFACADPGGVSRVRAEPQEDNLLRWTVTAQVDEGAAVHVEVRPEQGEGFRTRSVPAGDVALQLFGLRFGTSYDLEVVVEGPDGGELERSATERFTTDDRPDDFPVARVRAEPGSAVRYVLVNFAHTSGGDTNRMYLVDAEGEVVWYQDVLLLEDREGEAFWDGYGWDAQAHTLLALVGHRRVVVQRLDGALVGDFPLDHLSSHEVRRWEGRLYLPVTRSFSHDGQTWLEDGYAVLGERGEVERLTWLRDAGLDPGTDPTFDPLPRAARYWGPWLGAGSVDWTHVNAIDVARVDGREKVWLSLKNLNQVVQLDAETGHLDWRMGDSGMQGAGSAGDFVWAADSLVDEWFGGQHGVNRTADGTLLMFDNGNRDATSAIRDARALELAWDEAAGTVSAIAAHDVGASCDYRGSAFPVGDGEVLVTCGTSAGLRSFAADGAVVWEVAFDCPPEWSTCSIYRGVPVDSLGLDEL